MITRIRQLLTATEQLYIIRNAPYNELILGKPKGNLEKNIFKILTQRGGGGTKFAKLWAMKHDKYIRTTL